MFLMLDPQDEQFDRRLAFHLVSLYHITEAEKEGVHMVSLWPPFTQYRYYFCHTQDMTTLRDYIAYARSYLHPTLSEEAAQSLVQAYVGMLRSHTISSRNFIVILLRNLL